MLGLCVEVLKPNRVNVYIIHTEKETEEEEEK